MRRKQVSPELRKVLHGVATPIRKERGAILFREGQPGRGVFLIRSGNVRLTLNTPSRVYPSRTVGSGTVIGLPATLSGGPYSLTAEVNKASRLDFIPRRKMLSLLQCNPEAGFQILKMLSEEIFVMRHAARRKVANPA